MRRVYFDTRELTHLGQYLPVYRALALRGVVCRFIAYPNRPNEVERVRRALGGLPTTWVDRKEDALELYRRELPDWIVFGDSFDLLEQLHPSTRTALLYHDLGTNADVYSSELLEMDVRFMEGPYYVRNVHARAPEATLLQVGYAKLDPLFGPGQARPVFDLRTVGLDPGKLTLLYAPTAVPSSLPKMSAKWPAHFADFNLIVKPHYLSYFGDSRKSHRRKLDTWSKAPHCYVADLDNWNPLPFMAVADLLICDVSPIVFEFATLGRPIVCCDFTHESFFLGRTREKPEHDLHEEFRGVAAHARRYRHLRRVVDEELTNPSRLSAERRHAITELIGQRDGRVAERIVDRLLASEPTALPGQARQDSIGA